MRYFTTILSTIFIITIICLPILVLGQTDDGLVQCGRGTSAMCSFLNLFELIARIVEFLIFTIALPLCALIITWAGIVMALNPANSSKRDEAKGLIINACLGLALALASYLIVDTILTLLTDQTISGLESEVGAPGNLVE